MEKNQHYGEPVKVDLADVEKVRKNSGEVIKNASELVFGKKKNSGNKIAALKQKFPTIDPKGMPNEIIDKVLNATKTKKTVIHEIFDHQKDPGAMGRFVDNKRREGFTILDSRVIDNKTAHVVMTK